MTLEGFNDRGDFSNHGGLDTFNPNLTYYAQDFAVMSGISLGPLDYIWKPSKAKTTFGVIATGATLLTAVAPNPITGAIAAGAGVAAGGMAAIHSTYDKGGSGSPPATGTGYQPVGPNPGMTPEVKKPSLAMPLIVGAIGLIAAFGIAS